MDRTALITGCSSGIGRATALAFADAGWTTYATGRDPEDLDPLADRGCHTARLDVTDGETVDRVVEHVAETAGGIDCLVNNAGYGQFGPIEDVPVDRAVEQFDVNTFGPLRLIRAALPRMRRRGSGTVVNVTAGVGGVTGPGIGIYAASKFALETITESLRQEVGHRGVDVVAVQPGFVATPFYARMLDELDGIDRTPAYDDLYRVLEATTAVQSGGPGLNDPERVAETILRAASDPDPDPLYRVGPTATVGTHAGSLVRGRLRDRVARRGVDLLSRDAVQDRVGE